MIKTNKNTYLITPSLLNSWVYLIESDYGTVDDFLKTLNRTTPPPPTESILKGFAFEKWCEENLEEVQGGMYQCRAKKWVDDFLLYGKIDCVKAGIIYDFKYTGSYEVGKFYNNTQTSMYLELVPEATEMKYIITNQALSISQLLSESILEHEPYYEFGNIFVETYRRDEVTSIMPTIYEFMNWLELHGYMNTYKEKWLANN